MTEKTHTWLYPLKQWMEQNKIKTMEQPDLEVTPNMGGIMEACTRKRESRDIWNWAQTHNYEHRDEISNRNGTIRRDVKTKMPNHIKASVTTQIKETKSKCYERYCEIRTGDVVRHKTGFRGVVCRRWKNRLKLMTSRGTLWKKRTHCRVEGIQEQPQNGPRKSGKVEGLYRIHAWKETIDWVRSENRQDATLTVVSDGSVRNGTKGGTWAWLIIDYD